VADRLRRVLAVHAAQADERGLLASCSDASATTRCWAASFQLDSRKEAHCFDQADVSRCQSSMALFLGHCPSFENERAALVAERGLKYWMAPARAPGP
jgi:hypothetical protein